MAEIHDLDNDTKYIVAPDHQPGRITTELYNRLRAIQLGEADDIHGWNTIVE